MGLLQVRPRALAAGLASFVPGLHRFTNRASGGTSSARYCYSVWMRHLVRAQLTDLPTNPACVAELGPGDSLGIGLAAVLSGAQRYIALDAKAHANSQRNLQIFEELLALFRSRAPIPDDTEFPAVQPKLKDYRFPADLLPDDRLTASLHGPRVAQVRDTIVGRPSAIGLTYKAPWDDPGVIESGSVDFLLSQAVLEHVDDLNSTYHAMRLWMKPGATMSHSIDFSSHSLTYAWNGHWTLSDRAWRVVRGTRAYLINREPFSVHVALLERFGFESINVEAHRADVARSFHPARRFRDMGDSDRTTRSVFVQARVISH